MSPKDFKAMCKEKGLNYQQFSIWVGKSVPSIKLYATGKRKIPQEVIEGLETYDPNDPQCREAVTLEEPAKAEPRKADVLPAVQGDKEIIEQLRNQVRRLQSDLSRISKGRFISKNTPAPYDMKEVKRGGPTSSLKGGFK